jgi:hypothetical protein
MHHLIIPSLPLAFGLFAGIAAAGFMLYEKENNLRIRSFLIFLGLHILVEKPILRRIPRTTVAAQPLLD